MPKTAKTTAELQQELDELMLWFESDKLDIDEAIKKYEHGLKLITEIQGRLATAENTIKIMNKA